MNSNLKILIRSKNLTIFYSSNHKCLCKLPFKVTYVSLNVASPSTERTVKSGFTRKDQYFTQIQTEPLEFPLTSPQPFSFPRSNERPFSILQHQETFSNCSVSFCCSRAVTDPRDGRRVALKKLPNVFQSLVSSKRVFRELKMLCFFKHENVSIFCALSRFRRCAHCSFCWHGKPRHREKVKSRTKFHF